MYAYLFERGWGRLVENSWLFEDGILLIGVLTGVLLLLLCLEVPEHLLSSSYSILNPLGFFFFLSRLGGYSAIMVGTVKK